MKCFVFLFFVGCVNSQIIMNELKGYVESLAHPQDFAFQTKCFEGAGCFYNGPPWFNVLKRPFSPVPKDVKDIKFNLYTPQNPKESYVLETTQNSIYSSPFNPKLLTKLIVHGFVADDEQYNKLLAMKDGLLKLEDYNVIVTDFRKYVRPPFFQAIANARVAGARIARLLQKIMVVREISAESIHLIGFSLGGHICGYAGKLLPNLGRISAISITAPYFLGMPNNTRLQLSDAQFVDTMHTNGLSLLIIGVEMAEPYGHLDFYVNGGERQPGCIPSLTPPKDPALWSNYTAQFDLTVCDHSRALDLYLESVTNTKCKFRAVECQSYEDFQAGKCPPDKSTVAEMGFHAKPIPGVGPKAKFQLRTSGTSPFCIEDSDVPNPSASKDESWLTKILRYFF